MIDQHKVIISDPNFGMDAPLEIKLNGRKIWDMTPEYSPWGHQVPEGIQLNWPKEFKDRFKGIVKISIDKDGSEIFKEEFDAGNGDGDFELVDVLTGKNMIIDKWGRVAKNVSVMDPKTVDTMLEETLKLEKYVKDTTGLELFAIGGTLLGIERGGKVLQDDDDVDLSYMSKYDNITDITLESYELERALRAGGYDLIRYSGAHMQIYFPGHQNTYEFYIDILAYFNINDNFYGTAHAFAPREDVQVLPLKRGKLNGYDLPVPHDSHAVLKAIYGPSWENPDPAFNFVTPHRVQRRYYFWLDHMVDDMETWEKYHRVQIGLSQSPEDFEFPEVGSDFADFVETRIPDNATIVDLGSGISDDAEKYAEAGHKVHAIDFSRPAQLWRKEKSHKNVTSHVLNMYNVRDVGRLAEIMADIEGPLVLTGHNWWESLTWPGYVKLVPLIRQLLLKNQKYPGTVQMFFETQAPTQGADPRYKEFIFYQRKFMGKLREDFRKFGIRVDQLADDNRRLRYSLSVLNPVL